MGSASKVNNCWICGGVASSLAAAERFAAAADAATVPDSKFANRMIAARQPLRVRKIVTPTAEPTRLIHRNAYNLGALDFTPAELGEAIKKRLPSFHVEYHVDPRRQAIADSWPETMDDSAAREEWKWKPRYSLDAMVDDMLAKLR